MIKKEEVISFVWQHILLLVSLYVMTFGVAACVRSQLGSSVISTIPYVMASAGKMLDYIPGWTIGGYTIMMNAIFVVLQILILRRNFEWVQLFQLAIGFIFGMFIDLNMVLTQWMVSENILVNALVQIAGCTILGFGIAMEVKCGSVTICLARAFPSPFTRLPAGLSLKPRFGWTSRSWSWPSCSVSCFSVHGNGRLWASERSSPWSM